MYKNPLIVFSLLSIICLATYNAANALNIGEDSVLLDCFPTPSIDEDHYPGAGNVPRTNNLRRKVGIALVAKGEPIYITGRVVDEDCIPIDNVEVEIWQTNTSGVYQGELVEDDENYDENFLGAGYAKTDNLGRFYFLTIFPGSAGENTAPRIHFRVKHKDFSMLDTMMYFPEKEANLTDELLLKNPDYQDSLIAHYTLEAKDGKFKIETPVQDVTYNFNITLKGKYRQKHY